VDEERVFSMSAFEAAYLIRSFREKNPHLSIRDLVETIRAVRADFYSHDYEAGVVLEAGIPTALTSLAAFFTAAIEAVISSHKPLWERLAPAGRKHVLQAVGVNGTQCLRAAGLLDTSQRATDWWDALATARRSERETQLLAQGREGERLSLDYEKARLQREGILREPVWIAIDDNMVGYDILSFALLDGAEVNRLIEVKTTQANPPRMFLSRNEWETAQRFGPTFQFHLWVLPARHLTILSIEDVRPHIPVDHGRGRWETVEISI